MKVFNWLAGLALLCGMVVPSAHAGGLGELGKKVEKHVRKTIAEREKEARKSVAKGEKRLRHSAADGEKRVRSAVAQGEKKVRRLLGW